MKPQYEPHLEEDCHPFDEVFPGESTETILHVPGSKAPVSNVLKIWNSLARWIFESKTGFASFLRTLRSTPPADGGTAPPLWPIPAPYPCWFQKENKAQKNYKRMCVEKATNLLILSLSWLHLNRPARAPAMLSLSNHLSAKQWGVVKRFERLFEDLALTGDFGPSTMGRSAAKVESLVSVLENLHEATRRVASPYEHHGTAQGESSRRPKPGHQSGDPGEVVGSLTKGIPQLAKCVEPSRLSFPKEAPTFDPTDLFDEPHKSVFQDPISQAEEPDWAKVEPPRVRIHASKDQAMELIRFLDHHRRLLLVPGEKVRERFLCGAFSLVKDGEKDRLILDARPPNLLETTLRDWSKTLGTINAVLQIELAPEHNLIMSGTDLRDYYYCFRVSKSRASRNAFNFPLKPQQVKDLLCYSEKFDKETVLYPCLSTMAMGDCQAVELGQKCHVKIALNSGLVDPRELLCVHGRAPRGPLAAGVIIDDLLFLEQVSVTVPRELLWKTDGAQRLRGMKEEYLSRGLVHHPGKTFEAETSAEIWGAWVNGVSGLVRAAPKRLVPLMDITISTARLGFATVALLQALAGAWISVLQFRRRMLCLLDEIYVAQHGREPTDIVRMSSSLLTELWLLVCLAPLAVTDLRAQTAASLFLTDASEEVRASVRCDLTAPFARELHRHALSRGAWTRLLTPWKVWLQQHFQLDEEDALPEGVPLISHPLWLVLAQVFQFEVYHRRLVRSRKHINLLELESILELEQKLSLHSQDVRYLLGSDSQIAVAAILKGRSSSPRLNALLQQSIATVLGGGIYGSYGYVPSLANAGDDPTRWTDVRAPAFPPPPWLKAALKGDFSLMDQWLGERGYDPLRIAQLPFCEKFPVNRELLQHSLLSDLRDVQKPSRLAAFDQKIYGQRTNDLAKVSPGVEKQQQKEKKRLQEICEEEKPIQAVADPNAGAEDVSPFYSCTVHDRFDSCCRSERKKEQKESDDQTKNRKEEPSGKMNRGPKCHSVGSKGKSQPGKRHVMNTTGSPPEPPVDSDSPVSGRLVTAMENHRSPLLDEHCKELLESIPKECFLLPGGRRLRQNEKFSAERKGFLDLYSGRSAVARSLARRFGVWVVTIDFEHGSNQNLLDPQLQALLLELTSSGAFLGLGAAPECCSFSRAVHPPARSASCPWGLPGLGERPKQKVETGNLHAEFLLRVLVVCEQLGMVYWVENPDGSFLWLLPDWSRAEIGAPEKSFRVDLCRYYTPWRKRTRVATNTCLSGQRHLCLGGHTHVILRGRNKERKMSWTRMAQVYPSGFAHDLASAMAVSAGLVAKSLKLNIGGCARCSETRIGEAQNPGPRRVSRRPRDLRALEGVLLVEPTTHALQQRVWLQFSVWLESQLSEEAKEQIFWCPALLAVMLKTYGLFLFSSGRALYEFRHLLVVAQQSFSELRQHLSPAWQLLTKWEILQPVQHRKPLHFVLFQALVVMALLKNWRRWAGTLVLGFEGIARISEVLRATRADLVLPSDQFSSTFFAAFLRVLNPKTKRRGKGKVQHLKLSNKPAVAFLERCFACLDPDLCLFPLSAAAFRSRWEHLLDELLVPKQMRPTPASIRGGGAIMAYQRGETISDIMWRMRVSSQPTLEHYLQEMAADSIMTRLPETCKHRIKSAAVLYSTLIEHPVS